MGNFIQKALAFFKPLIPVGGIELDDSSLRFYYLQEGTGIGVEIRIPPGIVKEGKILQRDALRNIFLEFRAKLEKRFRFPLDVIVALPAASTYFQVFYLPFLKDADLPNAARLNLQLISPIPFQDAYADWALIGEDEGLAGQLKLLGVFTEKNNIDTLLGILGETGFHTLAIEPSPLSLVRAIHDGMGIDATEAKIILHISDEGIESIGVKNNVPYFSYFAPWSQLYEGETEITPSKFNRAIGDNVQKVLAFSASRGNYNIRTIILVADIMEKEIKEIIEQKFLNIGVAVVRFENTSAAWTPAFGAYLRGRIRRSQDNLITLTSVKPLEEFRRSEIIGFLEAWRNILLVFAMFVFIIFASTDFFLLQFLNNLQASSISGLSASDLGTLNLLQAKAKDFNEYVDIISSVKNGRKNFAPYLQKIVAGAGADIILNRIFIQSFSAPASISGSGKNQDKVLLYKTYLSGQPEFTNVDLPLTSLVTDANGTVTFSITLSLASLKTE